MKPSLDSYSAGRPLWRGLSLPLLILAAVATPCLAASAVKASATSVTSASSTTPAQSAQQAGIRITELAPFVRLHTSTEAWRLSSGTQALDWRILDAGGQGIPFARIPEAPQVRAIGQWRPARLFALPPTPAAPGASGATAPRRDAAGALVDLGDAPEGLRGLERLRLKWADSVTPFQVGVRLQTGPDLQHWRDLAGGQLLSLVGPEGQRLSQTELPLSAAPDRYLRLLWDEPAAAPALQAAELWGRPAGQAQAPAMALQSRALGSLDASGAFVLDLGGPQRLRSLQLGTEQGQWVLPLQVQSRQRPDGPWLPLVNGLAYRIERGAGADASPPWVLDASAVQLRILPPPGAALPIGLTASWEVLLPEFVFAAQGTPPYRLEVASRASVSGPASLQDVVPHWEAEQSRLGSASLEAFAAVPAEAPASAPEAIPREVLLWGVLGLGVLGLGLAAWRLARLGPVDAATGTAEPGKPGTGH